MGKTWLAALLCGPVAALCCNIAHAQTKPSFLAVDVAKYFSYQDSERKTVTPAPCDPQAVVKDANGRFARVNCADKAGMSVPMAGDISAALTPAVVSRLRYHGDLDLQFETGSAVLTSHDELNAQEFAKALKASRWARHRVAISGYSDGQAFPQACGADSKCTQEHNLELSKARAEATKEFLVKLGIQPERIEADGYGAKMLHLGSRDDRVNRRVLGRLLN